MWLDRLYDLKANDNLATILQRSVLDGVKHPIIGAKALHGVCGEAIRIYTGSEFIDNKRQMFHAVKMQIQVSELPVALNFRSNFLSRSSKRLEFWIRIAEWEHATVDQDGIVVPQEPMPLSLKILGPDDAKFDALGLEPKEDLDVILVNDVRDGDLLSFYAPCVAGGSKGIGVEFGPVITVGYEKEHNGKSSHLVPKASFLHDRIHAEGLIFDAQIFVPDECFVGYSFHTSSKERFEKQPNWGVF